MDERITNLLDQIGTALGYPGQGFHDRVAAALTLAEHSSELLGNCDAGRDLSGAASALADYLEAQGADAAAERYTVLFDLSPVCTMSIGYHVFGETYARGELLAGLVGELRRHDIDPGSELPDHLPVLLGLLGRMEDADSRQLLLAVLVLRGLDKMLAELGDAEDPWSGILRALPEALARLFPEEVVWPADLPMPAENELHGAADGFLTEEVGAHA